MQLPTLVPSKKLNHGGGRRLVPSLHHQKALWSLRQANGNYPLPVPPGLAAGITTGVPTVELIRRPSTRTSYRSRSATRSMLCPLIFNPFRLIWGENRGGCGFTTTSPLSSTLTPHIPKITHWAPDEASMAHCSGVSSRYSIWLATTESGQYGILCPHHRTLSRMSSAKLTYPPLYSASAIIPGNAT